ncbi:hypothetical protein EVAR_45666_1 [Eumeta japonica]|uniref:RNA-directed DNA polymerase from transposon BS n=1 Tax=Eumeta variegata TaxID=151549 RepID=A0A4C1Y752_EUMVA|nr:hypothetical protein EVAR_45666_1 [Eumeta japonica]
MSKRPSVQLSRSPLTLGGGISLRVIHSYLSGRHFTFRYEHTYSTRLLIRAGVSQGSSISPLLYSAYTNDNTATVVWRPTRAIQYKYSKRRSRRIVDLDTPRPKMLNANIPRQRNYKYLGVTLDKNLHFRDHIERVRKTAIFYRARLEAMLGRKKGFSPTLPTRTAAKVCGMHFYLLLVARGEKKCPSACAPYRVRRLSTVVSDMEAFEQDKIPEAYCSSRGTARALLRELDTHH